MSGGATVIAAPVNASRHRRRIGHRCTRHSTTKVMRGFTRHSVISPSGPVITLISLTHAPWMFLTVPAVFFSPERTASSTLVLDEDVISMTLAMAMADLPCVAGKIAGPARLRRPALTQRPERVSCYDPADESRAKPRARRPHGRGQVLDRQAPGQPLRPGLRRRRPRDRGAHRRHHSHRLRMRGRARLPRARIGDAGRTAAARRTGERDRRRRGAPPRIAPAHARAGPRRVPAGQPCPPGRATRTRPQPAADRRRRPRAGAAAPVRLARAALCRSGRPVFRHGPALPAPGHRTTGAAAAGAVEPRPAIRHPGNHHRMNQHRREVAVGGDRPYAITIGPDLLGDGGLLTRTLRGRDAFVISDDAVAPLYLQRVLDTLRGAHGDLRLAHWTMPAGEAPKTLARFGEAIDAIARAGARRDATVYALGGGVVGDLAGFAAAAWMRGVDCVQLPTTLLSMVDSSVGGKTAVDLPQGKNLVGAFHPPRAVLADTATLRTLPIRELRAGLAEVVKYGAIVDADFLDWLDAHADALLA